MLTFKQIQKLKPTFEFGRIEMVDWFEVTECESFCYIKSGLRHADGETKSPFYYEETWIGKDMQLKARQEFTEWWNKNKFNGLR